MIFEGDTIIHFHLEIDKGSNGNQQRKRYSDICDTYKYNIQLQYKMCMF